MCQVAQFQWVGFLPKTFPKKSSELSQLSIEKKRDSHGWQILDISERQDQTKRRAREALGIPDSPDRQHLWFTPLMMDQPHAAMWLPVAPRQDCPVKCSVARAIVSTSIILISGVNPPAVTTK
jgi:hypothetical protein